MKTIKVKTEKELQDIIRDDRNSNKRGNSSMQDKSPFYGTDFGEWKPPNDNSGVDAKSHFDGSKFGKWDTSNIKHPGWIGNPLRMGILGWIGNPLRMGILGWIGNPL